MEAVAIAPAGLLTSHTIGGYLDGTVDGVPARRAGRAGPRHPALRAAVPRRPRADRVGAAAGRGLVLGAPEPPLPQRAAGAAHRRGRGDRSGRTAAARRSPPRRASTASRSRPRTATSPSSSSTRPGTGAPIAIGEGPRFVSEVLGAVREAAPGLALGVRLSADSAPARAVVAELGAARRLRARRDRQLGDVRRVREHRAAADRAAERDRRPAPGRSASGRP